MRPFLHHLLRAISVVVAMLLPIAAPGQAYPAKPIKLIVPFPPGGGADTLGRPLAERMRQHLGQPIVLENRSGAASNIGTEAVSRAAPDGYTILINTDGIALYPHLYSKLGYDVFRDLTPIGFVADTPLLLAGHPGVAASDVSTLIALAKKDAGALAFANPGLGTPHHLAFELFARSAGVDIRQANYRGGGPALQDVLAGHVQLGMFTLGAVTGHIKAATIKPFAVMSGARSAVAPQVPTIAEAGLPGAQANLRFVLMAPAGTPPAIIDALHAAVVDAVKDTSLREQLERQGFELLSTSPAETGRTMRQEFERWGPILKAANLRLD